MSMTRGWCPGALRPMVTGDGLLVRLRLAGGVLPPATARLVADAAHRFGTGRLDLTARGNLQLRGVGDATLPALHALLRENGLLDTDAGAEARRNVLASPLAGLDPAIHPELGPMARRLEAALAAATDLAGLPAKFGVVLDGGGALPLAGIEADVRLDAAPDGWRVSAGGFALTHVAANDAVPTVLALARAFLRLARGDERRMHALARRLGAAALAAEAGLRFAPTEAPAQTPDTPALAGIIPLGQPPRGNPSPVWERGRGEGHAPSLEGAALSTGAVPQAVSHAGRAQPSPLSPSHTGEGAYALAAGVPQGRLTADRLAGLADLADAHACGLRLSPWRAILLAPLPADAVPRLAAAAARLGFITTSTDPRLFVSACPGAPGCASGQVPVEADLPGLVAALALRLGPGTTLHVSGCTKGCAHPGPAAVSLVGEGGRYGLALDARSADPREVEGLDVAQAAACLASLAAAWPTTVITHTDLPEPAHA